MSESEIPRIIREYWKEDKNNIAKLLARRLAKFFKEMLGKWMRKGVESVSKS